MALKYLIPFVVVVFVLQVKSWNMEQAEGYAELIESGQPGKIYSSVSSFCMFEEMSQDGYAWCPSHFLCHQQ